MSESRQVRRSRQREAAKRAHIDTIHQKVVTSDTILDLWNVYFETRFPPSIHDEPDMVALLKEVYYAGVASMLQLMNKAAGDAQEDDDIGAARLQRLYEELDTHAKSLR